MKKYLALLLMISTAIFADAVIFSGNDVKALKANLDLNGVAKVLTTTVDPSSSGLVANIGSIALRTTNGVAYLKTGAGNTAWTKNLSGVVNLTSEVTGVLPIANGGTGSSSRNFVDLSSSETIAGTKTFSSTIVGSISGNAATVTTNANLSGDVSSVGNTTTYSGIVPVNKGGTGSATQNFVDLTTSQSIGGTKTFTSTISGSINGNAATVTTNANLTGDVTSVGNATTYNGIVPVNKGGTGSATRNFVDLTSSETIAGTKTFSSTIAGSINGNAATVTTIPTLSNEVSNTGNSVTLSNSAVIAKTLTGFTAGSGTITSSDTILQGIQKNAGNDALKQPLATLTTKGDTYVATGASTVVRQAVGADDTALVADSTQTNGIAYRTSKMKGNLLANWSFEKSTVDSGWTITGGGTSATSTTNLHDGAASLTRTSTGAWTVVQDVTAFAAAKSGQEAEASIWVYSATASADLWLCPRVNAVSVTASIANGCMQYTSLGSPQKLTVFPLFGSTSTGIEIKGSGAITYILDDAYLGDRRPSVLGITTTPDTSYTPTTANLGTTSPASNQCKYNRLGNWIKVQCFFTAGTVSGGAASISLPSGLTIDTGKIIATTATTTGPGQIVGEWSNNGTNLSGRMIIAPATSTSNIYFGAGTTSTGILAASTASPYPTSSVAVSIKFEVPVTEWAGDNNGFSTRCDDPRNCETEFTASVSSAGVVSNQNTGTGYPWLSGNCVVTTTSLFTCPITSGIVANKMACTATVNSSAFDWYTIAYDLATSTNTSAIFRTAQGNTGASNAYSGLTIKCTKVGTDYSNSKIFQQIIQSRDIVPPASYWVSANFAASTTVPINFDSKEFDNGNNVTTSSTAWKYTARVDGTYEIFFFEENTTAGSPYFLVYKNGVAYKTFNRSQNGFQTSSASTAVRLLAGEYIDIRPNGSFTMAGGTLTSTGFTSVYIKRAGNY